MELIYEFTAPNDGMYEFDGRGINAIAYCVNNGEWQTNKSTRRLKAGDVVLVKYAVDDNAPKLLVDTYFHANNTTSKPLALTSTAWHTVNI